MGHHDLEITPIGFGAFKIGRNQGIKYPDAYDLPDENAVATLLNGALDLGINYIDTAPAYGLSEERIGRAIGHRRDEFVISSKVGETFAAGQSSHDFSSHAVRESVQRSLRLRRDALDIVFVHAGRDDLGVLTSTDVVQTLEGLRDQGLVKRIGFSGYTADAFDAALSWADVLMVTYHKDDPSLESVIAKAGGRGVAVVVKKALASGHLDAEEAIRFVLANPHVTSAVIGGLSLEHLSENVRVAEQVRGPGAILERT